MQLLALLIASAISLSYQAITTRTELIRIIYPEKVRSERDLPVCEWHEVCSVVHRRFWLRPVVNRLCQCRTGQECPLFWSRDNQTMPLDNRSQIKFCQSQAELSECSAREPAVSVTTRREVERSAMRKNKTVSTVRQLVTAHCQCQDKHYWKYHKDVTQDFKNGSSVTNIIYRCSKLRKCAPLEFCGNVRVDFFSTYYRCSCPTGHLCLFQNRHKQNVTELFYNGPAYEAVCYKHTNGLRQSN